MNKCFQFAPTYALMYELCNLATPHSGADRGSL
ncbi:hypothetical protein CPT_Mangalyan_093 [Escherichia phage Mangalyan]|nr:hypothetical protein CPT_Mangalyan_093 [Escherichia phage Mangalyan]